MVKKKKLLTKPLSAGYAMVQMVSYWSLTMDTQVQFHAHIHWTCGGRSSIGTGFVLSVLELTHQYYSTNAPYFIH
jgi:hypothetical protein